MTTRPVMLARNGMVSSPHYLASIAGLRVLQDGGSAVDAAVAVNATLAVVYPHMTGVGGDAFWLVYDAPTGRVHGLNASGRAGAAATRELFRERGHESIPVRGPLSAVTVPGAVDGWCTAHERFGSLPLDRVLAPAITYAREGYGMTAGQVDCLGQVAGVLAEHSPGWECLQPDGQALRVGRTVSLPRLAGTLEAVAARGRDGFYTGPVAEEITGTLQQAGGLLTADDFAAHHSDWTEPLHTTYRGFDCYQHAPNSQGFTHLMTLNVLEGYDVAAMGDGSVEYLHTLVEATKLVFADRDRYLTDPAFSPLPLHDLLSKEYAAELRERIDPAHVRVPAAAAGGDTTATVVVDGDGNAASVIQSLYHECGSGFVAGDTGVLLQNRGSFFSLDDEHVNRLEPGKRTFHTLMPGMLLRDGRPHLVYGTMGGEGQPQTSNALVTRVVDFGDEIQQAIDAPRWLYGRTWGEDTRDLRVESRIPSPVLEGLRRRNHPVRVVDDFDAVMGHAQAILVDPDRHLLMGGADPRGEGIALGW